MHTYVKTLQKVASRIAPSRILSFEIVHVLKTLQLIQEKGHVSRHTLCKKLDLGEGTVKTLVKHLKIYDLVVTDRSGTRISERGKQTAFGTSIINASRNEYLHMLRCIR